MIVKFVIEVVVGYLGLKGICVEGLFGIWVCLYVRLFNMVEEVEFNDKNFMIDFNFIFENLSCDEGCGIVFFVMDFL